MNKFFKKLLGHIRGNTFKWGELYVGNKDLALEYTDSSIFERKVFILKIPFIIRLYLYLSKDKDYPWDFKDKDYGFYIYNWDDTIVLCFGEFNFYIDFPWRYIWEKTELLDFNKNVLFTQSKKDKNKYDPRGSHEQRDKIKDSISQKYPYKYKLNDGTVQDRIATIRCIERWTWGMKWFPPKKFIRTSIDIHFNDEVGERTGSWKGGCIGCSYDLLPNETPLECLRRMEKERKF